MITLDDLNDTLPDTVNSVLLTGITDDVKIFRDKFGIPHIWASSTNDAFFGQGFASAQDRLWQMECDRRKAYGRWAEYLGMDAVEQDTMMRRFQILKSVTKDYHATDSNTRAMLDAYAKGVNAFIQSTRALAIEYSILGKQPEVWQPWDSLAVFKVRHILMGVFENKLWRMRLVNALGPELAGKTFLGYNEAQLVVLPPGSTHKADISDALEELRRGAEAINPLRETESGSNNWVLDGSRTASGKPLLAGDPHRALDVPNVYYQCHVTCPEFDVVGLSFAGCPGFPHFGHNATVAWCITHAMADYQDLYFEYFNKEDPTKYEFKDEWKQAEISKETIKVRDGKDIDLTITTTQHGPVISGDPAKGYGLAFRYTGTEENNTGFSCILPMLKAENAHELDSTMRNWVDPCNNLLCADVFGNIGYLTRGKIPIRPSANAWLPVPGWTGLYEWEGYVPFEELPRISNPESGYIVTANNRITGKEYPYYISQDFAPGFRARRIADRLANLRSATAHDMSGIHAERISIPALTYSQLILNVDLEDPFSAQAQKELVGWDGSMDMSAVAPTIYSAFRYKLNIRVMEYLIGPLIEEIVSGNGRGGVAHFNKLSAILFEAAGEQTGWVLPHGTSWNSLISRAFDEGVRFLRDCLGDNIALWEWGNLHFTRPRHVLSDAFPNLAQLLDPPSISMGGDGDTPQAAGYSPASPFTVTGMSVARYVFDIADWDNSRWIIPLGSSGHPGSPHYADQASIWGAVDLIPMTYSWSLIEVESQSCQILTPTKG
jgi:penicillin amidase